MFSLVLQNSRNCGSKFLYDLIVAWLQFLPVRFSTNFWNAFSIVWIEFIVICFSCIEKHSSRWTLDSWKKSAFTWKFQSCCRWNFNMELLTGFEPVTCWLRISCSTDWATVAHAPPTGSIILPHDNGIRQRLIQNCRYFYWGNRCRPLFLRIFSDLHLQFLLPGCCRFHPPSALPSPAVLWILRRKAASPRRFPLSPPLCFEEEEFPKRT